MSEEIKGTLTARSVDLSHYGKEPVFGPSSCSACGKFYTLGPHVCNPTYKELEAELATARDENKRLKDFARRVIEQECWSLFPQPLVLVPNNVVFGFSVTLLLRVIHGLFL